MILTPELRAEMKAAVLCWLASVDEAGAPSVSPKEIFTAHPERDLLLVAEIASPGSLRNIRRAPMVCVSFVDVFVQTGWKIYGAAEAVGPEDGRFAELSAPLAAMAGPDYPVRHVFAVTPQRAARILAPSYRLFPERPLKERMAGVYARYGVRPE